MTYSIRLSESGDYVLLEVVGDITADLAMQMNLEAHRKGLELNVHRYLVDLTQSRNTESSVEDFRFMASMQAEPAIDHLARVALLVAQGDHTHDFVQTLASNSGLDVTIFNDREAALEHLRKTNPNK